MLKGFFRFFAERHTLAIIVTLLTILLGLNAASSVKRDMFPNVDFGEVMITTAYPGGSPEDVELFVTNKIEKELESVTGIDKMQSWSSDSFSIVDLILDPNVADQERVKRDIRNAIDRVKDLPPEIDDPPLVNELNSDIFPVLEIGVSLGKAFQDDPDDIASEAALRRYADLLEFKLKNLPGVSKIEKRGYQDREVAIDVRPDALVKYQLSLLDIQRAIAARNIRSSSGTLKANGGEIRVVTNDQFQSPDDVADVIIRSNFGGQTVRVKDVAKVTVGFEEKERLYRMNGMDAITLEVFKKGAADVIRTTAKLYALIDDEQRAQADKFVIHKSNDQSFYVRNRFKVVLTNGALGLFFVIIILSVFLSRKIAFWVALGIPVSFLGAVFLLPFFDSYLDVISMMGMIIVIGIIVDDAIIIGENILKHREQGESPIDAAVNGISNVIKPVLTTIMTTLLAFAPMFFMPGIMGKFIYVIPLVVSLALFVSLFEAVVALPAHLVPSLETVKVGEARHNLRFERFKRRYMGFLEWFLRRRYRVATVFFVLLISTLVYAAMFMDFVLFPAKTADLIMVRVELPVNASLGETEAKTDTIEQLILGLPAHELDSVRTRIGESGDGFMTLSAPSNVSSIFIHLSPFNQRDRTAGEIVKTLKAQSKDLKGYKSLTFEIAAGGPPVGKPITIRVVGPDDARRKSIANALIDKLNTIDGVTDIDRNDKLGKPKLTLDIDYEKMSRLGLTVANITQTLRLGIEGAVVSRVRYGKDDTNFLLRLDPDAQKTPATLSTLVIPNRQNRLIRLGDVATLRNIEGDPTFYHFDGERTTVITGEIEGRKTTPIKVTKAIEAAFDIENDYPGHRLMFGGEAEETQDSMRALFRTFGIAALGIYFMLILLFGSLMQPLLVMFAIPFGISGVIIAFALHNTALGFLAMIGIIGLSGVVVNDSLVMVYRINTMRDRHADTSIIEVIKMGSGDRLRAVILTSVSTVAGLLPLAYGWGGADPFIAPMALALGYGLLFATPVTLILIPCFFAIWHDIQGLKQRATTAVRKTLSRV